MFLEQVADYYRGIAMALVSRLVSRGRPMVKAQNEASFLLSIAMASNLLMTVFLLGFNPLEHILSLLGLYSLVYGFEKFNRSQIRNLAKRTESCVSERPVSAAVYVFGSLVLLFAVALLVLP